MFTQKQTTLRDKQLKKSAVSVGNAFTNAGSKVSSRTKSQEGSNKYTTTGNDFVDQFGTAAKYRELRSYESISKDMSKLWGQSPFKTIALLVYLRLITRVVSFFDGSKTTEVQRGQGLKHESIFRMIWLAVEHPDTFVKNVPLFISVGSWKDIFTMMRYDLMWNNWENRVLDWHFLGNVIISGLENDKTSELVKKYLPHVKAWSKCTTIEAQANNYTAKYLANRLFPDVSTDAKAYKEYRKLKASGTAHTWQQLISQGKLLEIDFSSVHGRALALLVSGKFIENNKLVDEYESWLEKQPIVKFKGYVYELFKGVNMNSKKFKKDTVNKQFMGLVEEAKKGTVEITKFMVVMDTSASMTGMVRDIGVSAYNIAKSLALYFSYFLEGPFKDSFMEFSNDAKLLTWKGSTPLDKFYSLRPDTIAGTNFRSVAELFIRIKREGVDESQFPEGLLCLSDGEFHPSSRGYNNSGGFLTETENFKNALLNAWFSKEYVDNLKFVFWNIPNGYYGDDNKTKFESFGDAKNIFYMSGFDGAGLAFISGKTIDDEEPQTAEELFNVAISQEVMDKIQV